MGWNLTKYDPLCCPVPPSSYYVIMGRYCLGDLRDLPEDCLRGIQR